MCMLSLPWYPLSLILSISSIQVNEQKTYKLLCCKVGKDKNETEDRFKKTKLNSEIDAWGHMNI